MPILFSAVAYDNEIVARYASCDGNFMEILDEVMSKVPSNSHKMTYSHGHYLFHYIAEDLYLYFCITTKTCQRSRAFLYLNEIKRRITQRSKDFYKVLAAEMQRYSEDYNTIVIRKGELDELNTIGVDSSESILGEKVLFVNNPENLTFSTITYVDTTPQQSLVSECKINNKFYLIIVSVILVLLWLGMSIFGPISFVLVMCIFILSIVRLSTKGNKS